MKKFIALSFFAMLFAFTVNAQDATNNAEAAPAKKVCTKGASKACCSKSGDKAACSKSAEGKAACCSKKAANDARASQLQQTDMRHTVLLDGESVEKKVCAHSGTETRTKTCATSGKKTVQKYNPETGEVKTTVYDASGEMLTSEMAYIKADATAAPAKEMNEVKGDAAKTCTKSAATKKACCAKSAGKSCTKKVENKTESAPAEK